MVGVYIFLSLSLVSYKEEGERNVFGLFVIFNLKPEIVGLMQIPEWNILLFSWADFLIISMNKLPSPNS